ncbi:hypothetical protein POM88_006716 [Heracleum sosnowskyi]|uniref:RPN1 N-terminal domain-containing protein n=1 Tax=Heracleum sosnowskyi TaxID=360622 RepID=A0AAD8J5D0_9APIA|nr:hypothetical protein POM88_006716 [Heracleum sosnowskyi]
MLGALIFKLRALISILVRFCPHLASGKSAGHTGLSTRGGHLIRPTSPKSPSASAFESIEGSDDEDNMTDNSKVDSTYLYTNGDANLSDNGTVNGEPNIAASSMIRSYSVSGDLHGVQPDPVAADILRKEPEHETFVRLKFLLVREEDTVDDLIDLVKQIVAFHMQHNAEPEAVDLLMEVKHLNLLKKHVDKASYKRTCLYLSSFAKTRWRCIKDISSEKTSGRVCSDTSEYHPTFDNWQIDTTGEPKMRQEVDLHLRCEASESISTIKFASFGTPLERELAIHQILMPS